MRITLIAAMGRNHVIGTATGLPWHLPRDLKHFRSLTLGKPIILGRTTFEQIGRPLPDRANIVLSRRPDFSAAGVRVAHSVAEAIEAATEEADRLGADEAVVIGGAEVYRQFLPRTDRLHLTVVEAEFEGTTRFPVDIFDDSAFTVSEREKFPADDKNPHAVTFWRFDRVGDGSGPPTLILPTLLSVA
jgi:dihydrofolate reductase